MKKNPRLAVAIRRALELDEIGGGRDRLEMRGTQSLLVSKCLGILRYSESEIRLSLSESVLTVCGEGLYCSSYLGGSVRVDGEISSLSFVARDVRRRDRKG